jgi:hypothetical protein
MVELFARCRCVAPHRQRPTHADPVRRCGIQSLSHPAR